MKRDGFALITVLWLVAILAAVVLLGLAGTRVGQRASQNRLLLTRARWAAEACAAIAQARWRQVRLDTATVDLGRATRCTWRVQDPTARVNANTAGRAVLARLIGDSAAAVLVASRQDVPLVSDTQVAGFAGLLTVDGPGTINANAADPRVLSALPGIGPEAVERLATARLVGRPLTSLDALAGAVSPRARAELLAHYAELARLLTFSAPQFILTARGWVEPRLGPEALVATIELLVVPLPERLAVIRRRVRA